MSAAATPSNDEELVTVNAVMTAELANAKDEVDKLKKENDRLRERAAAAEALKREHERDDEAKIIFMGELVECKTARERRKMYEH